MNEVKQSVVLLWSTPEPELQIERAGRVSYKSEDKITDESSAAFIRMLVANGHHSVLEHASMSVLITTDRGITHEIVRHRIASYTQESTRYVNYGTRGGEINVVRPTFNTTTAYDIWETAMLAAESAYLSLIELGEKPQDARSVLPTCTKTEIVCTFNLREWRHFLTLRMSAKAHPQIQWVAQRCLAILMEIAPDVFRDLEVGSTPIAQGTGN